MWCLVPKAASTSWSRVIMNRLAKEDGLNFSHSAPSDSLQVVLKNHFGNVNKSTYISALKSNDVKKVLLIRHPFSRITSAYRDKLADRKAKVDGMHFYQRFGVYMNRKYRAQRKLIKQKEPTFDEFIDYLINTETLDHEEHWMPISVMCGLCHIKYDHVIAMEDLAFSQNFHLHKLGFKGKYGLPQDNKGDSKAVHLFRNVSAIKKVKLLKKYQDDFRLFKYNFVPPYS